MNNDLVLKMKDECRFFLLRKENLMEDVERKKIEVLDLEYRLETLKKDLARSDSILEVLSENGF